MSTLQARLLLVLVLVLCSILVFPIGPNPAAMAAPRVGIEGPFLGPLITPISRDGALVVAQVALPPPLPFSLPLRRSLPPHAISPALQGDPVRQTRLAAANMPAPLVSFDGLGLTSIPAWPPDPNGDVGPHHYVQAVNVAVGIYSKTGTLLKSIPFTGLFQGTGTLCDNSNQGDPIVVYDQLADRWLISDFAFSSANGPFFECIAVSKTGDPVAGGWWLYPVLADNVYLNDYPKLGLWPDGYYLSANMFDLSTNQQVSARLWSLDRKAMLNGMPLKPVFFNLPCGTICYSSLLPANLRGALPPAGSPELFASIDSPNLFHLWKFHVDWVDPTKSTLTGPTDLTVANFSMPCNAAANLSCVPQLNTTEMVDGLGDRLMMQLQYRNIGGTESLWVNHTVATSSMLNVPTGVRWYEIRDPNGSPVIYQQGTFQPDSNYRWMGSLAVDRLGNMAVGYSVSSALLYPAIRYAGRMAGDPLNTLTLGETSLINGTGSQSGGFSRWGDYSAMTIDPVDDCTFWYTNEYYAVTGNMWRTRIGSFTFPGCSASPPLPSPPPSAPPAPAATPKPPRCEDYYEPDDAPWLAHTITAPELHNFSTLNDQDWVKFTASSNWVYHIKAASPSNFPTEPRLELYVNGNLVASNDHYFGNIAEIWWWNNIGDATAYVRVTEMRGRAECGNSQYTLSVEGSKEKP
jgi:hypothetical protein